MLPTYTESSSSSTLWQEYHTYMSQNGAHHSVVGRLLVAPKITSPQLNNDRHLLVYLPPSYDQTDRRYPVLYMQDGQNLFDHATSYAGEWGVDETMEQLSREEQLEAIVVGIPNQGKERVDEYSPYHDAYLGGGRGNAYLDFIAHTVKPLIDGSFRTLPGRQQTGLMGSSMGGLISLYGFFRHPDLFGFAGVMSPSLWFARGAIFGTVETAAYHPGKLYLDAGTRELGTHTSHASHSSNGHQDGRHRHGAFRSRRYYASVRRLKRILVRKGYRPVHDLLHIEEKWANHSEAAWGRRLPLALRFFLNAALKG